jgi:hypothetical protein
MRVLCGEGGGSSDSSCCRVWCVWLLQVLMGVDQKCNSSDWYGVLMRC